MSSLVLLFYTELCLTNQLGLESLSSPHCPYSTADFEESSCYEFFSSKEMNSANNLIELELDPFPIKPLNKNIVLIGAVIVAL
jgi:hypothetical protein